MEGGGMPSGYQYPPGFRFHPTDQELIGHYLSKKIVGDLSPESSVIAEIDLYKSNPWDLPAKAFFGEGEWFFFSPRDRKYPNGARPNRAAGSGYWKATGTDKPILAAGGAHCLGVKKALVFYKGRPPKGIKTDWVMHEYRLLDSNPSWPQKQKGSMRLDDWVLCRVRQKGSLPPQAEEKNESSRVVSHPTAAIQSSEKPPLSSPMFQWSDYKLLAYLMGGSAIEEGESGCEGSYWGSVKPSAATPGSQQLPSMLESIKRNLSFGALDEMLMPSNKRMNCYSSDGDQSSPTGSASVDQVYQQYMI